MVGWLGGGVGAGWPTTNPVTGKLGGGSTSFHAVSN